jgi:hypothetical protein
MRSHEEIDLRSLAMDRLIAQKLRADPQLIDRAKTTLLRWKETAAPAVQPTLAEWDSILDQPLPSVLVVLEGTDERSVRLRQSSPFCGILTRAERTRILLGQPGHEPHAA